ncbi:MAG: hypothetical protein RL017_567 [Pseudomonadota bacterium]|jgi:hypothetical protein
MLLSNKISNSKLIILACVTALLPEYIIRSNIDILYFFYNHFTTYFGDLWYCWSNYLNHGFSYPREYPSGIQLLFRLLFVIPGITNNLPLYMRIISLILAIVAIAITYLLIQLTPPNQRYKIWQYWILAPSYLFFGLLNLDFLAIVTMVIAYYYFIANKFSYASIALALGMTIKVFPVFLLPMLFFACARRDKFKFVAVFCFALIIFNLPFILTDYQAWSFPYLWQIQNNYARTMQDGSWMWIIFTLFNHFGVGNLAGKFSLLLFICSYFYCAYKYNHLPLARKLLLVIMLFILTDRVYSPQYNLYLLPFLVLVDYKIDWKYFYLLELPNFFQGFFLFYTKNHPYLLQSIIFIKYFAIIMLLRNNLFTPVINNKQQSVLD